MYAYMPIMIPKGPDPCQQAIESNCLIGYVRQLVGVP